MTLLAEALRAEIRALVREELRANADVFTSRALPPDVPSRRRFHEVARGIPTAAKRGRTWIVPRADWEAHRKGRRKDALGEAADAFIARARFRPTRAD